MGVTPPSKVITDLGDLTPHSTLGAPSYPIAVSGQFAPTETRARRFDRTKNHRMYSSTPFVTDSNGEFSLSTWLKFTGTVSTGVVLAQFTNSGGTKSGGFLLEVNSLARYHFRVFDINDTGYSNVLRSRTGSHPTLDISKWHNVIVTSDSLSTSVEELLIYVDGVDVSTLVTPGFDSTVYGTGVVTFDDTPGEFSIGNYSVASSVQNSPDFDIGKTKIWDGVTLTPAEVSEEYSNEFALIGKEGGIISPILPSLISRILPKML
jgi:hypothetical protein